LLTMASALRRLQNSRVA